MNKEKLTISSFRLRPETIEALRLIRSEKEATWDEVFQYLIVKSGHEIKEAEERK